MAVRNIQLGTVDLCLVIAHGPVQLVNECFLRVHLLLSDAAGRNQGGISL
jgi:hypothetical protein